MGRMFLRSAHCTTALSTHHDLGADALLGPEGASDKEGSSKVPTLLQALPTGQEGLNTNQLFCVLIL